MTNDVARARGDSLFPEREGPSFCSRPTPVVPADPELREDATDSQRPGRRVSTPSLRPSDRPTFVPDDYVAPRLESPPTITIEEALALEVSASEGTPGSAAPHALPTPPPLPRPVTLRSPAPERPRATGRTLAARFLFVVLFGAATTLLGYALAPRFAAALEQIRSHDHQPVHAIK